MLPADGPAASVCGQLHKPTQTWRARTKRVKSAAASGRFQSAPIGRLRA